MRDGKINFTPRRQSRPGPSFFATDVVGAATLRFPDTEFREFNPSRHERDSRYGAGGNIVGKDRIKDPSSFGKIGERERGENEDCGGEEDRKKEE